MTPVQKLASALVAGDLVLSSSTDLSRNMVLAVSQQPPTPAATYAAVAQSSNSDVVMMTFNSTAQVWVAS